MSTFSIRLPAKVLLALLVLAVVSPAHAARSGGPRHRSAGETTTLDRIQAWRFSQSRAPGPAVQTREQASMNRSMKTLLALTLVLLVVAIGVSCGGLGEGSTFGGETTFGGDETHGDALRRALMHRYPAGSRRVR